MIFIIVLDQLRAVQTGIEINGPYFSQTKIRKSSHKIHHQVIQMQPPASPKFSSSGQEYQLPGITQMMSLDGLFHYSFYFFL